MSVGESIMESVRGTMEELISCCEEEESRLPETLANFEEAFEIVNEKVSISIKHNTYVLVEFNLFKGPSRLLMEL